MVSLTILEKCWLFYKATKLWAICFPKQIFDFLGLVDFPISDLTPYIFQKQKISGLKSRLLSKLKVLNYNYFTNLIFETARNVRNEICYNFADSFGSFWLLFNYESHQLWSCVRKCVSWRRFDPNFGFEESKLLFRWNHFLPSIHLQGLL